MKNILILIFGTLLLIGCGQDNPSSNVENIEPLNAQTFQIEESNIALSMPKEFMEITHENYNKLISMSDMSDEIKTYISQRVSSIGEQSNNNNLFIDSLTYNNVALIQRKGPHITLNKEVVNLLEQTYMSAPKTGVIVQEEEIVQKQLVTGKSYSYIKLKIQQKSVQGIRYLTNYLISTNKVTLSVSYLNAGDTDYQDYINQTKFIKH